MKKKPVRPKLIKFIDENLDLERRSTHSTRCFLKEFCLEFLNSFSNFMSIVKNRLDSGKSLVQDQTYYFWAITFFLQFAQASNIDVELVKNFLSVEPFHFIQTNIDLAFDHLKIEKKNIITWTKRIHIMLKAYLTLLEILHWMDCSKKPLVRALSREIKSDLFYVMEYREMTLSLFMKFEANKFSITYLKTLIQTAHLFIKLLEEFSKSSKLIVQKISKVRKKKRKGKKSKVEKNNIPINKEQIWEKICDDLQNLMASDTPIPDISPFDATLDTPIEEQKERAMKNIQKSLHLGNINEALGLFRSSRQVWPENDCFGNENMTIEDELSALKEICLADLLNEDNVIESNKPPVSEEEEDDDDNTGNSSDSDEAPIKITEQDFNMQDFKRRLVHKKVVEICGLLLKNYKNNSDHVNHCAVKLLHRIGWDCNMPAMLYQASLFQTLLNIMNDKHRNYSEMNTFTINLFQKFRKHASENSIVFLELLFWKDYSVALEIQNKYVDYGGETMTGTKGKRSKKKLKTDENSKSKKKSKKKMEEEESFPTDLEIPDAELVGGPTDVELESNDPQKEIFEMDSLKTGDSLFSNKDDDDGRKKMLSKKESTKKKRKKDKKQTNKTTEKKKDGKKSRKKSKQIINTEEENFIENDILIKEKINDFDDILPVKNGTEIDGTHSDDGSINNKFDDKIIFKSKKRRRLISSDDSNSDGENYVEKKKTLVIDSDSN